MEYSGSASCFEFENPESSRGWDQPAAGKGRDLSGEGQQEMWAVELEYHHASCSVDTIGEGCDREWSCADGDYGLDVPLERALDHPRDA